MWPSRQATLQRVKASLQRHSSAVRPLVGITDPRALEALALQFVASLRREDYYRLVRAKPISPDRANPHHPSFDAERAVSYHVQQGNVDEAAWMIFLMTHFAKPAGTGWLRLRDLYGGLGGAVWDWQTVSSNPIAFKEWVAANWQQIRGKFGNHRKYETLRPHAARNLGAVVDSYIAWIGPNGHARRFADAIRQAGNDPHVIFSSLYDGMNVLSFGRLAKFDYLSTIGRYGIAPIAAGSAYLDEATGPAAGARLLFDGHSNSVTKPLVLQMYLDELDTSLSVGMAVMEDAICNWQKSPLRFKHFRG